MADTAFKITGLDGVLESLKALPLEVSQKRGGPVRKVVRSAAHIIRDEVKRNAERVVSMPNEDGRNDSTGTLVRNIKTLKGKYRGKGERYIVTVPKRAKYPGGLKVQLNAQRLEYGTSNRQPMPFFRPAFHAKKTEALQYVVRELPKEIDKVASALARKNIR